jgi:hypothetical protein
MYLRLRVLFVGAVLLTVLTHPALADDTPTLSVAKAIKQILMAHRPRQDGVLTVRDNMLFVQCLDRPGAPDLRCEAAGLEGEPWLHNVLTMERQDRLMALGFKPDTTYGNFVRTFPRSIKPARLAEIIVGVLTEIYGADAEDIEALTDWLPTDPCHPRIKASHDRGGSIATPQWGFANDIGPGCKIVTNTDGMNYDDPDNVPSDVQPIDLDAHYGAAIAAQITRLEAGHHTDHIWAIFEAGVPYVQCAPDTEDNKIYCEAASEDSIGAPLARLLTADRRQKLIVAGFEPPGKEMNFRRFYPLDHYDAAAIAHALLTVLHDSYGYTGTPAMMLKTEKGDKAPL